eukprot:2671454-Pleurochrysis_carterae.AAC.4
MVLLLSDHFEYATLGARCPLCHARLISTMPLRALFDRAFLSLMSRRARPITQRAAHVALTFAGATSSTFRSHGYPARTIPAAVSQRSDAGHSPSFWLSKTLGTREGCCEGAISMRA